MTVPRKLNLEVRILVELVQQFELPPLQRLHNFSFRDALITRAANQAGCTVLFSDDLEAARELDGLRVADLFACFLIVVRE